MSIDQTNVVDLIRIDRETGYVVLSVVDHLDWSSEQTESHLLLLQDKLNMYLAFLESGEIYESYPQYEGHEIKMEVVGKYPLSPAAEVFYKRLGPIVEGAGFRVEFKLYRPE